MKLTSLEFFARLKWLDGSPLLQHVEEYRRRIFSRALDSTLYSMVLAGRGKKNAKTLDLVLAGLYCLVCRESPQGSQCFILANDEGQAADDLDLAKKLVAANPLLAKHLSIKLKLIERRDHRGALAILPAKDVQGAHGKSYVFVGYDELHGYRDWSLLEALQPDPTRSDVLQWITTYASLWHRPGAPLFDLMAMGKAGSDDRLLFSWYSGSYTTDPDAAGLSAEDMANPSRGAWENPRYLEQQRLRLPSHMFRRLHLCEPGLPEGSAYGIEPLTDSIQRGVRQRPPEYLPYVAFVDMSGGSQDDCTLGIAHVDPEGRAVLDYIGHQGQAPPFDPRAAVGRFAGTLKAYGLAHVVLDRYAGQTFPAVFADYGISSEPSLLSASELYEAFEPCLNGHRVSLLDHPVLESQLLGLIWRGGKITHPSGEHDDFANAAVGALLLALQYPQGATPEEEPEGEQGGVPVGEVGEDNFLRGW